jgi:hypothetical protein
MLGSKGNKVRQMKIFLDPYTCVSAELEMHDDTFTVKKYEDRYSLGYRLDHHLVLPLI